MRNRLFLATGLLVALLVAGLGSYYASGQPDGLNKVAEQTGFDHTEKDSATADGPFAGYRTSGVGDDRLSGGLAGVAGVLMVGVLGGGLFWVLRRRDGDDAAPDHRDS
jgi:cobalt/nickel transport system permease protein/cobalt/nickel transport protein